MQWRKKRKSCWVLGTGERSLLINRVHFNFPVAENESDKHEPIEPLANETDTGRQHANTQHSNYTEDKPPQDLPSMNSGQSPQYQYVSQPPPFYSMVGGWSMPQYPRFYYPTLPQAGYRPLQPLEWFNPRLPANCQYYYAMNSTPRSLNPQRTSKGHYHRQFPFYWNSILLNPYNTLTNQPEENTSTTNYVYPGHYYGPASFNQNNHVTTPPQQAQQSKTVDQHKPKKKRKRKRKRKLHPLKITRDEDEDRASTCSTQMEEESAASSETRDPRESSNADDDQSEAENDKLDLTVQNCDSVKVESPCDVYKFVDNATVLPDKPIGNDGLLSRDQLPLLPLVDDLFAVSLVDEIVARALEIVSQRKSEDVVNVQEAISVPEEVVENEPLSPDVLDQPIFNSDDLLNEDQCSTIPDTGSNSLPLDFYIPEDDDSEDSELQELMENSRNSVSPTQSGFRPLDEEDIDDAIELPKVDGDSVTSERMSINCTEVSPVYSNRAQVGSQPVNWLDCNGFQENESESPDERELVTEIVFISETSFMDESHPTRAGENQMREYGDENDGGGYESREDGSQSQRPESEESRLIEVGGEENFYEGVGGGGYTPEEGVEEIGVKDELPADEEVRVKDDLQVNELEVDEEVYAKDESQHVKIDEEIIAKDQLQLQEKLAADEDVKVKNELQVKEILQSGDDLRDKLQQQEVELQVKDVLQVGEDLQQPKDKLQVDAEKLFVDDLEEPEVKSESQTKDISEELQVTGGFQIEDVMAERRVKGELEVEDIMEAPRAKGELEIEDVMEEPLLKGDFQAEDIDFDEELTEERYMDIANHEQFYDPLKYKDYYQICTNVEVPDSPSIDKSNKSSFEISNVQPPPKPPRLKALSSRENSVTKELDFPNVLANPRAEIVVHEVDNVSECGSEDVDTIGLQYQKPDEDKHVYVNQLSLAAELLRTQQSIPYDKEFKPLSDEEDGSSSDVTRVQDTASTSHSNREIYDKYYGNARLIPLQEVTINQPQRTKEISDSGVQSEESSDEGDDVAKGKGDRPTGRPIGYKLLENKAKPLSAMLKGKGDPLCLCCNLM